MAGAKSFTIQEVSADKAYIGRSNLEAVAAIGAEAYIPFHATLHDDPKSPLWSKDVPPLPLQTGRVPAALPQAQQLGIDLFAIKRLFGEILRSKTLPTQVNELLLKVIAYNITCMVHSILNSA